MSRRAAPDDIYVRVGAALARLRRAAGLTQEALAVQVGVEPSYVARIEAGSRRATLDKLALAAAALGVPIAALFADEKGPTGPPAMIAAAVRGMSREQIALVARVAVAVRDTTDIRYESKLGGGSKPAPRKPR